MIENTQVVMRIIHMYEAPIGQSTIYDWYTSKEETGYERSSS